MSPDKWETIKSQVNKQFSVEEQGKEDLLVDTADGQVKQGEAEYIIFEGGPLGRMKLQFQKKPKLEDKTFHYSKRAGDSARVEYKFSESETVYTLKAYKWDDARDDWKEIDASNFA
jgi:hypothetical protein